MNKQRAEEYIDLLLGSLNNPKNEGVDPEIVISNFGKLINQKVLKIVYKNPKTQIPNYIKVNIGNLWFQIQKKESPKTFFWLKAKKSEWKLL